ncbi:hypothetical protein VP01_3263g2 [Puccinia sorghi]|uniref:Retrotransposon Copia-like N-terminal domain-containing protein n=1 Tax=Puccinia sorghi TaxID=27349 RepID=A0A0L6UXV3_9BASI|nr:hypothetical protein VP01_3263g2 [Puccinia sorghi]
MTSQLIKGLLLKLTLESPSFGGSNYLEWETAINRALQHAFVLKKSFLNDKNDRFLGLDLLENKAVAALLRSTLNDALLAIVESQELSLSKELFVALRSKCQRSDNLPASESCKHDSAPSCLMSSSRMAQLPLYLLKLADPVCESSRTLV